MRYLVVSDSHGRHGNLEEVIERVGHMDAMIHLGDAEGYEDYIESLIDYPLYIVRGNNDFYGGLPYEKIVMLGEHKALMVHGHRNMVGMGTRNLHKQAVEEGCEVAFYGHTHVPHMENRDGVIVFNPGSIALPRQSGRRPSYGIVEVDTKGDLHFTTAYLE